MKNPEDLASYGLDKPKTHGKNLHRGNNEKPEDGVILGKKKVEAPEPKSGKKKPKVYYYARRLSGGPVMLINEKTCQGFAQIRILAQAQNRHRL